jgi:pyruvate formate lyase activating enzyme
MKEALFYKKLDENKAGCFLCMHQCRINDGKRGICGVRENRGGMLYSLVYGKVISMNIDPIEKKPLFHFMPASKSFSIATAGCNFKCLHCQNFDISQYTSRQGKIPGKDVSPEQIVEAVEKAGCDSISYTYTEPTVFFEFALDCARLAKEKNIKNVFVSNGYSSPESVKAIAPFLDAINIDLKGDDDFYKKICGARLQPVLDTVKLMKDLGIWVEVTTLIIPSYNDSDKSLGEIADYIYSVDDSVPWHVSQFYPTYKILDIPRTPIETIKRAREIGLKKGLKYVYEGNVPGEGGENTYCPDCNELLIERLGYEVVLDKIRKGLCPSCKNNISGVWRE